MKKIFDVINLSRRRAREGHLALWQQLGEMVALRVLHGIGPGYYHMAGFWRRGVSWRDKTGHLNEREYERRMAMFDPIPYRMLSRNKIPEKAILDLFDIPTPRFLGRLEARVGRDTTGRRLHNAVDLERLAREQQATRLVFKHPEGWRGEDIHLPLIEHGETMTFLEPGDANPRSVQAYCSDTLGLEEGGDFVVEEYVEQHPLLSALNASSVNTVRVWVADLAGSGYQVILAHLRIGRGGSVVDNPYRGGLTAPIDKDTGRLGAAREEAPDFNLYPRHPDHGARIEGIELPYWSTVQRIARRALSVFPRLRFAGLDIAIGPDGPRVLELNTLVLREGAAIAGCPSKIMLKP